MFFFKRIKIRSYEYGLWFRDGEFAGLLRERGRFARTRSTPTHTGPRLTVESTLAPGVHSCFSLHGGPRFPSVEFRQSGQRVLA